MAVGVIALLMQLVEHRNGGLQQLPAQLRNACWRIAFIRGLLMLDFLVSEAAQCRDERSVGIFL